MSRGYTDVCGLVVLKQIRFFNSDFSFNDEHSGLIVLCDVSIVIKLVIDFYEEDSLQVYDLQLFGEKWIQYGYKSGLNFKRIQP